MPRMIPVPVRILQHRIIAERSAAASKQSTESCLSVGIQCCRFSASSTSVFPVSLQDEGMTTASSSSSSSALGLRVSPDDIARLVAEYSRKQPTSVSLQMLMKTGRGSGDFWGRTYHSSSNKRSDNYKEWGRLGQRLASDRILIQMATYLRHELPVRLAHRIRDLDTACPPQLRDTHAVQAVKGIYVNSLVELTQCTTEHIYTLDDEQAFAHVLASLYQKHAGVLVQMAKGAYELRQDMRQQERQQRRAKNFQSASSIGSSSNNNSDNSNNSNSNPLRDDRHKLHSSSSSSLLQYQGGRRGRSSEHDDRPSAASLSTTGTTFERMEECHQFLDRFYMSRIGIRFLAGQYLALRINNASSIAQREMSLVGGGGTGHANHQASSSSSPAAAAPHFYIGMICQRTSPYHCVQQALADATMMCRRTYGRCPKVNVTGRLDLCFPYIPTYLHYILLELLKNALRATMDHHLHSVVLPPVTVIIADGTENEDVVIKIADEGGGIPRSHMDRIWSYLYTTADPKIQERFIGVSSTASAVSSTFTDQDHGNESPLAGLGFGLPIAKSYCRYFGGDLDLLSMEGFGTDVFVHLKKVGDSKEPVPV